MKNKPLILKFSDSEKEYSFEDKLFTIEDKDLIKNLEKTSIKNSESKLVIKSLDNTHISDVIQIKVNMSETGYFLVNFVKDTLNEGKRTSLLDEIRTLKSDAVQTNSTQLSKAKSLCEILNKYEPIYVSFVNNGEFHVDTNKLASEALNFPLLVLKKEKARFMFNKTHVRSRNNKNKDAKDKKTYSSFPLFEADYIFILLFAALGTFGILTCIFEIMNKETISIFLGILGLAFVVVLAISVQSTMYKKGTLINPYMRLYLCPFIIVGIVIGIVSGFFVSKLLLKTEIENFDYSKLILLSSLISAPAMLSSLASSMLVNIIIKKKYNKAK